ncbi:Glyoxylate/hydroxypyruvate reductase B [Marinobacterium sp. xm-a-121]|uniref:2-hydroxyacid dehydrogenase n=1 Tax=unclassified Marinobacterium TaxID=2644139 RepID=UPI001568E2F2|nr:MULTISPECIES: 2-hydroxyacid dehydrogenase [unclassified Marinobacterium]NRP10269.1 Glyoxylate/hydroxypyruvate reductase B [Marinobacterium sp. xm-g-48]NRP38246.1 Glyoxylate/hydroxypyruvate reductase B [Marinobacterium sp. xm-a-121]NRP53166.1 Glyoxylate/hydroxypyruvate reductase B [Marinobacterium sp. xm-v-242]NRP77951.1 Glyoxylate/hydroxypyruvate reductase B [Marinobacterium sp. xm-m-383]NRP83368.1 Glyoxylate/hydroxypyruvate reductase B [Marinobacterium sp. xm-d-509]
MDKPKALLVAGISAELKGMLAEVVELVPLNKQGDANQFLADQGADFELVVTSAGKGCANALMEQLPNLKVIFNWGVGYDKVDAEFATSRNVYVTNTPDVLNECVADMAIGMLISQARCMGEAERFVRRGEWLSNPTPPMGQKVSGKRLGIVGLGRIGLETAKRAEAFSMQIRYHNRHPREDVDYAYEASIVELAKWSDYLLLLCPSTPETYQMIDREVLQALGPQSSLINIARGAVVDQKALVDLLLSGELGGAALDVFEREPEVPEALMDLPNVLLLPHVGSATFETRTAMAQLVVDNVKAYIESGSLVTPVN